MKQFILFASIVFALTANAQGSGNTGGLQQKQSYSFTLGQAIAHALEHNRSSINATRDIEAAKQKKWETTASGLPQISAAVDYTDNLAVPLSVIPAQFLDPSAPAGTFAAVAFSPKHSVNARANLNQLIFDGSYIVALQASKTYLKYYQNYKRKTDTEVKEMVTSSYGNVLLAEESIAILEKNKSTLSKTLSDTRETFKNGLIEEENVEQLQITLSTVENNLNYTRRVLNMNYKLLKVALGIDINDDLKLTEKLDQLTISNLGMAFAQDEFNMANNVDYQIAENFKEQRRLEYKLQKSKALPSLSANLSFGYNAFDEDFTFLNKDQKYYNFSALGISLNVPIFSSGMRSARTQQAKIAFEQAKTQLTDAEQKLRLRYEDARSQYDFSIEEFNTAKSNLNLAERIERKQQTKFTEGLSTSFDFADAQRQLYSAQQSYLQSMVNIINKKAALETVLNK
jgi:outer membrane protein